jgi:glucosamine 6-phosphate synthetase-like amidotransferase/phosphosugar isomerase protein
MASANAPCKLGSPLVVGYGDDETYLGSDALALAPLTQRIAYLGVWATTIGCS